MYSVDKDEYEADCDDEVKPIQERETVAPLRSTQARGAIFPLRGGGRVPVVETVTDEDTEEGIEELEQPQPTQKNNNTNDNKETTISTGTKI